MAGKLQNEFSFFQRAFFGKALGQSEHRGVDPLQTLDQLFRSSHRWIPPSGGSLSVQPGKVCLINREHMFDIIVTNRGSFVHAFFRRFLENSKNRGRPGIKGRIQGKIKNPISGAFVIFPAFVSIFYTPDNRIRRRFFHQSNKPAVLLVFPEGMQRICQPFVLLPSNLLKRSLRISAHLRQASF